MTEDARSRYFTFKDALQGVIESGKRDMPLDSESDKDIRQKAHDLRMNLAQNVGMRIELEFK